RRYRDPMSETAAPAPRAGRPVPPWLRPTLVLSVWCWCAVALAFALARALVAAGAGLHPLALAGYSVLIFLVLPAVVAALVTAAAARPPRAEPPAWGHAPLAAPPLRRRTRARTGDLGWALVYGVGAALAAGVAVLARGRGTRWGRIGVLALGVLAVGGAWAGLEGRG